MYSVYSLSDPRTNEVRYIGMSVNVQSRYDQHMTAKSSAEKYAWIQELKQSGTKPLLAILEKNLKREEARKREQHWICFYLNAGSPLFNSISGIQGDIEVIDEQKLFSPVGAAAYLSQKAGREITVARLAQLRRAKRVKFTKFGRNTTLYTRENLDQADTSFHFYQ